MWFRRKIGMVHLISILSHNRNINALHTTNKLTLINIREFVREVISYNAIIASLTVIYNFNNEYVTLNNLTNIMTVKLWLRKGTKKIMIIKALQRLLLTLIIIIN